MLYTDSDVVSLDSMSQIDSEVISVAATTKPPIAVEGPGSICEQAWRECGSRITSAQQTYTNTLAAADVSGSHQAAVNYTGTAANRPRTRLNQIVATESQYGQSASQVELWMAYSALALFFRDASSRKGQDRFEDKYTRYLKEADFWWRQLRQNGLPFIAQPMEAPGGKHGANPGTWTVANLSTASGSGSADQTVQVAITYYDASRYQSQAIKGNAESGPSAILSLPIPAGQVLRVDISSFNPPTGIQDAVGFSQAAWTPLTATHWNLWVGAASGVLFLQQGGIPIGTKTFTLAGDPALSGFTMGRGQFEDLRLTFSNMVGRG